VDIQKNELLKVIFKTPKLKERIDIALDEHSKINAIKELRGWCETTSYPAWLKDLAPKLRLSKDVIDAYCVRVSILRKLNKLSNQIEKYCNKHGYNKMGYREGAKSKDGLYTHKYTDYELVDDHIGFIVNNLDWYPNSTNYKEYNKLWRKYNVKYYKNIRY
jgi:hypothetical protein